MTRGSNAMTSGRRGGKDELPATGVRDLPRLNHAMCFPLSRQKATL
jgi:hypothetical protein